MSDTPRSDAAIVVSVYNDVRVPLDFARELERELQESALEQLVLMGRIESLEREMHKLAEHNQHLRVALDVCETQFCAINADWTDPRDNTDKGLRAIAAALEWSAQ